MAKAPLFEDVQRGYRNMWTGAKLISSAVRPAQTIVKNKSRYEAVADKIGDHELWPLIGALHWREAGGSFAGVLHNGERIIGTGRKTRLVPAGRGPFDSWEDAAVDALRIKGWHKIADWPIERWLYEAERFNGWGYFARDVNSPYIWAGTNMQQAGKYVADHV